MTTLHLFLLGHRLAVLGLPRQDRPWRREHGVVALVEHSRVEEPGEDPSEEDGLDNAKAQNPWVASPVDLMTYL